MFMPHAALNSKYSRRENARVKFDHIPAPIPDKTSARKEFMALKVLPRSNLPFLQIQSHPSTLRLIGIKIDNCQNNIPAVFGPFAVSHDLIIACHMEGKSLVALQRWIFPPD